MFQSVKGIVRCMTTTNLLIDFSKKVKVNKVETLISPTPPQRPNAHHWQPTKRVSLSIMERIRFLAKELPEEWPTERISSHFRISYEAVKRIVRSSKRTVLPQKQLDRIEKRKQEALKALKTMKQQKEEKEEEKIKIQPKPIIRQLPSLKQMVGQSTTNQVKITELLQSENEPLRPMKKGARPALKLVKAALQQGKKLD